MCKGKGVKEEKCDFIVGMAKAGATISKIVDETKLPKGFVTTIFWKYRLRVNVFQNAKGGGRPPNTKQKAITYDMGLHVLWWSWSTRYC